MNINELEAYSQALINRYGLTQATPDTILINTNKMWLDVFGIDTFKESISSSTVISKDAFGTLAKKFIQPNQTLPIFFEGSEEYANAA